MNPSKTTAIQGRYRKTIFANWSLTTFLVNQKMHQLEPLKANIAKTMNEFKRLPSNLKACKKLKCCGMTNCDE